MDTTLLITTGATVTFGALLESTLTESFLLRLCELGITTLVVQFGNEAHGRSLAVFTALMEALTARTISNPPRALPALLVFLSSSYPELGTYTHLSLHQFDRLTIKAFAFTSTIAQDIAQAAYVVSHAGTGAILDVLRQDPPGGRKLVVVNNASLMDNHQEDIGEAFAAMGVLLFVKTCAPEAILEPLTRCVKGDWQPKQLPLGARNVMASVVQAELLYAFGGAAS